MNGAVYISFFQGQLESVLEQVVQLAVQEISKTVGSSLNAMLLETAVKEQENHRLRLQLQNRDGGGGVGGSAPKTKAGDERADGGRTKHELPPPPPPPPPPQQQPHAPGGQGTQLVVPTDGRRLEQRGRVVEQLKCVMERVLDFAVCELTKIVEASFDDLLLEITKMEREQQTLEERLGRSSDRGGGDKARSGGARRRGSENDSVSPSGSEEAKEEVMVSKETTETDGPDSAPVLTVSQDWVPILDKVFGQKWCSDIWHIKELEVGGGGAGAGGRSLHSTHPPHPPPSVNMEPSPSSPQQDPRWTPLEDMEVFSPDADGTAEAQGNATGGADAPSGPSPGPTPGPAPSPTGSGQRRSSASMLHRLLTLPSQLLEDDEDAANETLVAMAIEGAKEHQDGLKVSGLTCTSPMVTKEEEDDDEEEEEEDEDRGRKKKRRRIWSECSDCGRRFSRVSLLKTHRQTHITDSASPASPASAALRCSECGKRFSSVTRLHSHVRTQHPGIRS